MGVKAGQPGAMASGGAREAPGFRLPSFALLWARPSKSLLPTGTWPREKGEATQETKDKEDFQDPGVWVSVQQSSCFFTSPSCP